MEGYHDSPQADGHSNQRCCRRFRFDQRLAQTPSPSASRAIGVFNEWGRLREVLVGKMEHDTAPRWSPDWGRYHGLKEMLAGQAGVPGRVAFPERTTVAIAQTEALARLLEDHGVIVHRPRLLTEAEIAVEPVGASAQFARDPQVVIGKHVIETNLRMTFRNKEHLGYAELFRERLAHDPQARHVRMPDVTSILPGRTEADFFADPRPFLEGGDTFVIGKDILVGFSSLGSSPAGADWLQRYLAAEGYRVHLVPLTTEWLHLDCIFAVIRPGLCMCHLQGLRELRLPAPVRDWEVIEATAEEAHALGCNTLCLEPGVVIVGAEHKRLIRAIEQHGATVVPVPFDAPSEVGGGIRCSTHPLLRDA
jgi:N-dimethylarginine dimethylaminohydrolase